MDSDNTANGLVKTIVDELVHGMYVAALDKPWLQSSFLTQGFYVRDADTIRRLAAECTFVYVDPRRRQYVKPELRIVASNAKPKKADPRKIARLTPIAPKAPKIYEDTVSTADELAPAQTSIDDAVAILEPIIEKVQASGNLQLVEVEAAVKPLVASVLRNKDAVAALLRLKKLDDYSYAHSISNAVWAALLGRHIGYPQRQINKLALGCALVDIGKVTLPKELLRIEGPMTDAEWAVLKTHVAAGVAMLESSTIRDKDVINIVKTHHERIDGSGYPEALCGDEIPAMGRIAGIIDTYDAMITERQHAAAMSSYDAINTLNGHADTLFERELVEHLTQAIGLFPTGTLVELNTGEVGVVTAQNAERRLRPKVTLILTDAKQRRPEPLLTDLNSTGDAPSPSMWIKRELARGAYGIEPAEYFS